MSDGSDSPHTNDTIVDISTDAATRCGNAPAAGPTPSMFEQVACYCCGSAESKMLFTAEDDYTGKPGTFHFVQCTQCELVYQTPRLRIEHIKPYYDDQYISHRKQEQFGPLTWFYNRAMGKHDRDKRKLVSRYCRLSSDARVLDVGCAAATFLSHLVQQDGVHATGVDFKDLSESPWMVDVDFCRGLFYEQELPEESFDLITMWHFLEHDYDPVRSLQTAAGLLTDNGRLVIEVPRYDSWTRQLFRSRWPGVQAPQHTALFTKNRLLSIVENSGLEVVDYLPYGAFPPYFYLFAGVAFTLLKGRGLNLKKAILPYFLGNLLTAPVMFLLARRNLAMQTVVCRRPAHEP